MAAYDDYLALLAPPAYRRRRDGKMSDHHHQPTSYTCISARCRFAAQALSAHAQNSLVLLQLLSSESPPCLPLGHRHIPQLANLSEAVCEVSARAGAFG